MNNKGNELLGIIGVVAIFLVVLTIAAWVLPQYNVWSEGLGGKAELEKAQYNRQIAIEEANAIKESAKLLAEAEVERAYGVAGANEIIGNSLKENEEYLRYLWIIGLQDGSSEVIYIPTEANLPILEARDNRLGGELNE